MVCRYCEEVVAACAGSQTLRRTSELRRRGGGVDALWFRDAASNVVAGYSGRGRVCARRVVAASEIEYG